MADELKTLPTGKANADDFEDFVGKVIRLCFFRWLGNAENRVRDIDGKVIRDWIVSNTAHDGFWDHIRQRYHAMNVVWECKNYEELDPDDFHQINYYLTPAIGGCCVLVYRGEKKSKSYYGHIRRIAVNSKEPTIVLLVNDRDLQVFIRQAISGKSKDSHMRGIFDDTIKAIS
jgi:hypothetical protein